VSRAVNGADETARGVGARTRQVKSRLIAHFGVGLILAGVFLTLCTVFLFVWMTARIQEIEMNRDFAQAGAQKLGQSMRVVDGKLAVDESLLARVRSENGWLQLLDEDGRVIDARYAPPELPDAYDIGQITAYWQGRLPFPYPYDLYFWVKEIDGATYTLLYGTEPAAKRVLRQLGELDPAEAARAGLPEALTAAIRQAGLQVQLLDADGRETAAFNKFDAGLPGRYTLSELALRSVYSEWYQARVVFDYRPDTRTTWVVTAPLAGPEATPGFWNTTSGVMLAALLALLAVAVVLFSALAIRYANRFGTPVLHFINWLEHLADGRFHEPTNRKGRSPGRTPKGRLRRPFRLFANVVDSLTHLTHTLRQNEEMRRQLEQTREEWIAGVSHDLKTPLSSIKGYAHMLAAEQYRWTEDEVREFSGIILEKADYMEALIDDLSLTYRLKNKALPLDLKETDAAELVRDVVKRFRRNPRFAEVDVQLRTATQPLFVRLDARWMSRALENLLVNAFIHNPPGTKVEVDVTGVEGDAAAAVTVAIRDNGAGMDADTVARLFERYYRGSNTAAESAGSGLGMAVARQIVLAHGGDIAVESAPGRGTTVTVKLQRVG
jgi:signal transduction histidine kinase